jgi:hypothetical protein
MATREKSKRCAVCLQAIDPNCDWKQGRCPHRPPMIEIQPKDTSKGHFYVSLVKSVIRIMAGVALINGEFIIAGGLLIVAEILGVVEELV